MNSKKLRIPRVAMAVLVLGGTACDDEDNKKKPAEDEEQHGSNTTNDDASVQGTNTNPTDKEEESARDSGTPTRPGAIDVSQARIAKVAADFCMSAFTCDQEYASEEYGDQETCVADQMSYFEEYTTTYGDACGDAQLDFYACLAAVDCDTDLDEECEEEFGVFVQECE